MKRWLVSSFVVLFILIASGTTFLYMTYEKYKNTLEEMSLSENMTEENITIDKPIVRNINEKAQSKNNKGSKLENEDSVEHSVNDKGTKSNDVESEENLKALLRPLTILLYGVDKRTNTYDRGRPDTIMLALINPKKKQLSLISLPRDAYVSIPGYKNHKLNTSFSRGGVDLTIETIENLLDCNIDGYASIDFKGFKQLVNMVGGIEMDVEREMHYDATEDGTQIHLSKGLQHLNGKQALDYVRFRHSNDGRTDSDYKRMDRQQKILTALGKKISSYRSITKVYRMLDVIGNNVKTSLRPKQLDLLIRTFSNFKMHELERTSLTGVGNYQNGMWVELISKEEKERVTNLISEFTQK
jgi:LCP family protein required for cell wall assembly